MNFIGLKGFVTADPELKENPDPKKQRVNFRLAVKDEFVKNKTHFIPVVAWGRLAEIIRKYCFKGSPIIILGRLHTSTYDSGGKQLTSYEVIADKFFFAGPTPATEEELPF